jgi:hypothetical protein
MFSGSGDRAPREDLSTPGPLFGDPPNINDPSRLVRRSTDRSLAGRYYVPPRSTVQFLPGAYDFSNNDGPLYSSSIPSQVPSGTQAYDFATSSGPHYSQFMPRPEYYPYQNSSSNERYYHELAHPTLPVEADSQPIYPRTSPVVAVIPPLFRDPPPPSPQNTDALDILYLHSAAQAENLETHQARALFAFMGSDPEDLNFEKDDIITVISKVDKNENWW